MVIKNGEPWLLWPNMVSYGINTGEIGKTFEGDTDFTLSMNIKILTKSSEKRTVFAKLPNYMGLDIEKENNNLMLILNLDKNGKTEWKYLFVTLSNEEPTVASLIGTEMDKVRELLQ